MFVSILRVSEQTQLKIIYSDTGYISDKALNLYK